MSMKQMKQTLLKLRPLKTGVRQKLAIGFALMIIRLCSVLEGVVTTSQAKLNRLLLSAQVLEKLPLTTEKSTPNSKKTGQEMSWYTSSTLETFRPQHSKSVLPTILPNMEQSTRMDSSIPNRLWMHIPVPSVRTIPKQRLEEVLEFYARNTSLIGLA